MKIVVIFLPEILFTRLELKIHKLSKSKSIMAIVEVEDAHKEVWK